MEWTGRNRWLRFFVWLTALIYGASAAYLLFIRDRRRFMPGEALHLFSWHRPYANLTPFRTIRGYLFHSGLYNFNTWFQVLFGNLVLFLPFGFLAPLLNRHMRSFPRFLIVLLLVLLSVELAQKFTLTGAFDVDDIILNMIGGIIGFWAVRGLLHLTK